MDNKKKIRLLLVLLFVLLTGVLTVWLWPWMTSLADEQKRVEFQAYLSSLGVWGWLVFLGMQVLQIVVAFLPGEPLEILSGVLYGTWGGMFTCLLGILVGSGLVFFLAKKLGMPFITLFVPEEKIKSMKFLQDVSRLELVTFLLFFIPGTPKDALTYVAGLTPISPVRFLMIATLARIPSVVTSTWVGASLGEGNLMKSLLIFAATGVIGIGGILIHRRLMAKMGQKP